MEDEEEPDGEEQDEEEQDEKEGDGRGAKMRKMGKNEVGPPTNIITLMRGDLRSQTTDLHLDWYLEPFALSPLLSPSGC
ncbi:hypothetical protein A6R68_24074 [Neotoma lepida]|uniref:Uncharacterized protein n=1 Tax=Neotoma lepida TaxID=56216 RepID=A0A1A6HUN2_NEOLE|nr:hypothetical protein A6R68_24074 [Neotoma lepida]